MIWTPPDVDDEPRIALREWFVIEINWDEADSPMTGKTRHFVGVDEINGGGRVSSSIQSWDPEKGEGVTRSGRRYSVGGPARVFFDHAIHETDASYTFGRWRSGNGVPDEACLDVTEEYLKK